MKLSNGLLRVDFDDSTGDLIQIANRRTGAEFLDRPGGNGLVKLIVPTRENMSRILLSRDGGRPRMTKKGDRLTIRFPELKDGGQPTGVFLTAIVRLPAGSDEAFFTLKIRNTGPDTVVEAWFPVVGGRAAKRGRHTDTITMGFARDQDFYDRLGPRTSSSHAFCRHHQRFSYGTLPVMDLGAARGHLSYVKYDGPTPTLTKIVFENHNLSIEDLCMSWAWAIWPYVAPGETWTSPECGIGAHDGDWHVTADKLKAHAAKWWKPSGMPDALREKIGMFHVQVRGFSGEAFNAFKDLPDIGRDCLQYGVRDLSVWDCTASVYCRPDTGGFWEMPARRKTELKRALAALRDMGCRTNACVNWRLLTRRNRMWKDLESAVQKSRFGQGMYGFPCGSMDGARYLDPSYEQGSYSLCQCSAVFRRFAPKLVKETLDLGFTDLFIDQMTEENYCHAKNHGHADPREAFAKSFAWFKETLDLVHARDPEAYVVAEIPELHNTQWADLWWNWGYRDGYWVRPEVLRYVLPGMVPLWMIDENQMPCIAEAFATGSLMAIATRDMTGRLSDAPALARRIARLAELRKATAPFVSHGTFRDTVGLTVDGGRGYVFTSPAGAAVTLANDRGSAVSMKATFEPETHGLDRGAAFVLHVEGRKPESVRPRRRGGALMFEARLPAYGAAVITADRGTRQGRAAGDGD